MQQYPAVKRETLEDPALHQRIRELTKRPAFQQLIQEVGFIGCQQMTFIALADVPGAPQLFVLDVGPPGQFTLSLDGAEIVDEVQVSPDDIQYREVEPVNGWRQFEKIETPVPDDVAQIADLVPGAPEGGFEAGKVYAQFVTPNSSSPSETRLT